MYLCCYSVGLGGFYFGSSKKIDYGFIVKLGDKCEQVKGLFLFLFFLEFLLIVDACKFPRTRGYCSVFFMIVC